MCLLDGVMRVRFIPRSRAPAGVELCHANGRRRSSARARAFRQGRGDRLLSLRRLLHRPLVGSRELGLSPDAPSESRKLGDRP
jgi:hypothetical protein